MLIWLSCPQPSRRTNAFSSLLAHTTFCYLRFMWCLSLSWNWRSTGKQKKRVCFLWANPLNAGVLTCNTAKFGKRLGHPFCLETDDLVIAICRWYFWWIIWGCDSQLNWSDVTLQVKKLTLSQSLKCYGGCFPASALVSLQRTVWYKGNTSMFIPWPRFSTTSKQRFLYSSCFSHKQSHS